MGSAAESRKPTLRDQIIACLRQKSPQTPTQIWQVAYDALGGSVDSWRYMPTLGGIAGQLKNMETEGIVRIIPKVGPRGGLGYELNPQRKESNLGLLDA